MSIDNYMSLERRIKTILPDDYQDCYEDVQPVSMGSAGLRFDPQGNVAWNEMWASFCDLAMAGGPPHKGTLLEPAASTAIDAEPEQYQIVVDEICRGVEMVTDLNVAESPVKGWVRVGCLSEAMAGWLLRAITMENVSARVIGRSLDVPAGPGFRLEKEIKNVVTVMAKTCHYWLGHTTRRQQHAIAELFTTLSVESPLVVPALAGDAVEADTFANVAGRASDAIQRETGLVASSHRYTGWLGIECPTVRAAIWMMRAQVVSNVLSRREGTALFLPINPAQDPGGNRVVSTTIRSHGFARANGVL